MAETLQISLLKPLPKRQSAKQPGLDGKFPTRYFNPQAIIHHRRTQFWDSEGNAIDTDVVKTWSQGFRVQGAGCRVQGCSVIDVEVSHVHQPIKLIQSPVLTVKTVLPKISLILIP